jgi:carboxypeptidase Taq
MELNTALEQLKNWQAKMSAYGHAMALIYYDGATTAPKGTAANRGQTLSILSEESYRLSTGEETVQLLEYLDSHKEELAPTQRRIVFLALKEIRNMQKIPMEEYVAYQQVLVEAEDVWHTAKETNDFASFCPHLEKIFETERRFAGYCAPEMHPYNYCLDKYEDGLTMEKCDAFFATLKSRLVPLIQRIAAKPQLSDACIHGDFDEGAQEKFSLDLMRLMGIDLNHCGLSTTEHPFTTSLGSHHDVRITTNYDRENVSSSMFSVIHEGGHALYDMNSHDDYAYTLLDGGVSMGIHESQSRFYENLLGRSRKFLQRVFPLLCEAFPDQTKGYTAEDFYRRSD